MLSVTEITDGEPDNKVLKFELFPVYLIIYLSSFPKFVLFNATSLSGLILCGWLGLKHQLTN